MAAKKKPKSKAKPKPPAAPPKPKAKPASKPAAKRAPPRAKRAAVPKKAKPRAAVAKPQPPAKTVETPQPVIATPPPPPPPPPVLVRPGLQKRADIAPIGIVRVSDGIQLIEESTFYSAPGRDEYVQRWTARGYTCRFMPTNS